MVAETELDVRGSFETKKLMCGEMYKVSFLLKTQDCTIGKVNLELCLPDGSRLHYEAPLPTWTNEWEELEVGRFKMTEQNVGTMTFVMWQSFVKPAKGLIIGGVVIKARA
ncbi:uncharacterized protein LOC115668874 [Syzygium oleosum]|uniref:uncharacterized protein LOC115668874 n=1 Tax=Syzygium oleosum TaxID=219896 RepID=UPI0024B97D0D|nr:uncharacterized protein LOC115668874 [Syzygium oleosum]